MPRRPPPRSADRAIPRGAELNCVIIAPTLACNLRCRYCLSDSRPPGPGREAAALDPGKALLLLESVLAESRFPTINVIFGGGEPTLVPAAWFEELLSGAARAAGMRGKTIRWSLQTNGVGLGAPWLDVLKRHGVAVGVSIDGPPELSAGQRAGARRAADCIRLLRANGMLPGALVVGTRRNLPHIVGVLEFLAELGVPCFHILPLLPLGRAGPAGGVSASLLAGAYAALLDSYLRDPGLPRENRLGLLVRRFVEGGAAHMAEVGCSSGLKPCGTQLAYLASSGGLFPCMYATDEDLGIGRVADGAVRWTPPREALNTRVLDDAFSLRCLSCAARAICGFSCPAVMRASPAARERECEFHQAMMELFAARRRKVDNLHAIWYKHRDRHGDRQDA